MTIAGENTGLLFSRCLGRAGTGPYPVLVGEPAPGTGTQCLYGGEILHGNCR
jgi:hypothetical protein